MNSKRQVTCSKCVMDTSASDIYFDEAGVCNYCHQFSSMEREYPVGEMGKIRLEQIVEEIGASGKGKPYDCLVGISGGTDSTYTLLMTVKYGLRPLAVHFDNGWNGEIAVSNIYNALKILDLDLETYVVDWEEFKDIQLSFLKASVPEVETPTDMGIRAVLYDTAAALDINYIIEGTNFRAEGIVPKVWGYKDGRYINSVHARHGVVPMNTYPNVTLNKYIYYNFVKRIKLVRFLNYLEYDKAPAKKILKEQLSWRDYGAHHAESVYTRFFQYYLAPIKFNMDRRKVTLSALVRREKISREEALSVLQTSDYLAGGFENDKKYISKKLGISLDEFESILSQPPRSFFDYESYYQLLRMADPIIYYAHKLKIVSGVFQGGRFTNGYRDARSSSGGQGHKKW